MRIGYYAFAAMAFALGVLLLLVQTSYVDTIDARIVQSGSMEPAIGVGALVLIWEQDAYEVGEVITFMARENSLVPTTHRVIDDGVQSGEIVYYTKGDANEDPDPDPVPVSRVMGEVVLTIPYLGYLLDFARQPLGFALLIGVPALLILFEEISSIVAEVRRKKTVIPKEENTPDA